MNKYFFSGIEGNNVGPSKGDLTALGYLFLFGDGYQAMQDPNNHSAVNLMFDLPFSLSNLNLKQTLQTVYDTKAQSVNEYSDKPYPVKGYLGVVFETVDNAGLVAPDMDNYIKIPFNYNISGGVKLGNIFIGLCNSTQTDFYTPFNSVAAADKAFFKVPSLGQMFFTDAAGNVNTLVNPSTGGGGSVTTWTPPFNPNTVTP